MRVIDQLLLNEYSESELKVLKEQLFTLLIKGVNLLKEFKNENIEEEVKKYKQEILDISENLVNVNNLLCEYSLG